MCREQRDLNQIKKDIFEVSEDGVFPFENLKDPFEEINLLAGTQNEIPQLHSSQKRTSNTGQPTELFRDDNDCCQNEDADASPNETHERNDPEINEKNEIENNPRHASVRVFYDPLMEKESWAQLDPFFENEQEAFVSAPDLSAFSSQPRRAAAITIRKEMVPNEKCDSEAINIAEQQNTKDNIAENHSPIRLNSSPVFKMEEPETTQQSLAEEEIGENNAPVCRAEKVDSSCEGKKGQARGQSENGRETRIVNRKLKSKIPVPRVFNLLVDIAEIECPTCGKHFGSKLALKRHTERVHTVGTIPCNFCPQKLKSVTNRVKHERTQHDCSDGERWDCDYDGCSAFFNKSFSLSMHKRKFHGVKSKATLRKEGQEEDKRVYVCGFCEYSAKTVGNLNRHVFSRHGAARVTKSGHRFVCEECGGRFTHSTNQRLHECRPIGQDKEIERGV
ncbi:unnamed protein product [Agarophyton chilense]